MVEILPAVAWQTIDTAPKISARGIGYVLQEDSGNELTTAESLRAGRGLSNK